MTLEHDPINGWHAGQRVVLTPRGVALAQERQIHPTPGIVRDIFSPGTRNEQLYVLRDAGGFEWWPSRCWKPSEDHT